MLAITIMFIYLWIIQEKKKKKLELNLINK